MNAVIAFFSNALGPRLATLLGSMIPLIELKGSIMFARSETVGLGFFEALGLSYAGSSAVFFLLIFLLVPVLNLLKKVSFFRRLAEGVEGYFTEKAEKAVAGKNGENKDPTRMKKLAVFLFVAVPLPMTGVWTGTAVAVFLGLDFKKAALPVLAGNLVAGAIISVLAELFLPYVDYILYGLFAVALALLIVFIVKVFRRGKSGKGDNALTGEKAETRAKTTVDKD